MDGNLFFNELLFASMKRIFGPELLENTSSEIQALLQLEEKKIRKKMEKKKSKISQKYSGFGSFFSSAKHFAALKKHSVNPIITILFVGMALKTWKRFAQRKINGELLPNDSLPYIYMEEESSYESSVSEKSLSSYVASKEDSSSYESKISLRESQINENEEFDSKNDDSIEKKSESLSSGSKLSIDDIEEIKKIQLNKGRRFKRFSQLSLLKDFLWNKAEGKKNSIRSSNMFINFLGRHSSNFSERSKFLEG